MHTCRKRADGLYDVVFATSDLGRVNCDSLIAKLTFESAIWYVNILNGGSGRFDKDKA